MSYTKREFISAAFEEIGLASYTFDLSAAQWQSALRRLDTMMADWINKGIRLGYPLPSNPSDSDLDSPSQVPDTANEAVITNLAIRLAPSYGRQVMAETRVTAKAAYDNLLSRAAMPFEQQFPGTMPAGAGNKPWRVYDDPFLPTPVDPLLAGQDSAIDFN